MEANVPSMTGWLSKKGGGTSAAFKRRFCKLVRSELLYYKKDDPKIAALGWIDLSRALCTYNRALVPDSSTGKLVPNKQKTEFSILCLERNWIFRADSPGAKDVWLKKVNEAIEAAGNEQSQDKDHKPLPKKLFEFSKQGYLTKRGNRIKSWKQRYFGLSSRSKTLYYFKNELDLDLFRRIAPHAFEQALEYVQGTIPLGSCTIHDAADPKEVEKKDHCFWIDTPQRNYPLCASNAEELKEWKDALTEAAKSEKSPSKLNPKEALLENNPRLSVPSPTSLSAGNGSRPSSTQSGQTATTLTQDGSLLLSTMAVEEEEGDGMKILPEKLEAMIKVRRQKSISLDDATDTPEGEIPSSPPSICSPQSPQSPQSPSTPGSPTFSHQAKPSRDIEKEEKEKKEREARERAAKVAADAAAAPAAADDPCFTCQVEVVREGFLIHRSYSAFERAYFVLPARCAVLFTFESKDDFEQFKGIVTKNGPFHQALACVQAAVPLEGAKLDKGNEKNGKFPFAMTSPDRKLILLADSAKDQADWMECITIASHSVLTSNPYGRMETLSEIKKEEVQKWILSTRGSS